MAKKNILIKSKLNKVKKLLDDNDLDNAEEILAQIVKKVPLESKAWLYMGYIEGVRNRSEKSSEYYNKALSIKPNDPIILYNIGIASRDLGDYKAASESFQKSLIKDPENTRTLDCLAHVCLLLKDYKRAEEIFLRSLEIDYNKPETHSNLGSVYQNQGKLTLAEQSYQKALLLNPDLNIYENIGSVLLAQGQCMEAIEVYRKGIAKRPKNPRIFSNLLMALNYIEGYSDEEIYKEHKRYGDVFEDPLKYMTQEVSQIGRDKISIAYYSPDFRQHSVAYFIEPVIEHHNKEKFETFAYFPSKSQDVVTKRLKGLFDEWRDISGLSMDEIIDVLRTDKIDIFVDLAGHTSSNILPIFAKRPVPVQVTYLGYPNTTGLNAIQYRITDSIADPSFNDKYYSEKLHRIPGCFLTYKPDEASPDVTQPPVIRNKFITYGSFNNLSKMSDGVIKAWSGILKSVRNSRLLIKNPSLTDQKTKEMFYEKFRVAGIEESRIDLMGHTPTRNEHLSLYSGVDIALDTFPYNGTATTCEALWMGLPVVTLKGVRHASRVGASILEAIDRPEWIASTNEEYIRIAIDLGKDITRIKACREEQREKISGSILCDHGAFVSNLESSYLEMMDRKLPQ